jgi:hypothetical protein
MTTTTSSPSTAIAIAEPVFMHQEQLALAGFLAGYTGLTREAYALDLRQYANWCQQTARQELRLAGPQRPGEGSGRRSASRIAADLRGCESFEARPPGRAEKAGLDSTVQRCCQRWHTGFGSRDTERFAS